MSRSCHCCWRQRPRRLQHRPLLVRVRTFHPLDGWISRSESGWSTSATSASARAASSGVLDGCAIIEHWQDARGGTGKSLFYPAPPDGTWHQVWVTNRATTPGGVKEKRLIARYPNGAVRFQGEVVTLEGLVLDRTTLTPLPEGAVRQLIETSRDGGATWIVGFDAAYRRRDKG